MISRGERKNEKRVTEPRSRSVFRFAATPPSQRSGIFLFSCVYTFIPNNTVARRVHARALFFPFYPSCCSVRFPSSRCVSSKRYICGDERKKKQKKSGGSIRESEWEKFARVEILRRADAIFLFFFFFSIASSRQRCVPASPLPSPLLAAKLRLHFR